MTTGLCLVLSAGACGSGSEAGGEARPELPDGTAGVEGLAGPYRMGDVELLGDTVLVEHDDDLWVLSRDGGDATRLLPGEIRDQEGLPVPFPRYAPAFSPEGDRLAFSAGTDAYVLDRSSHEIRRLTYHPRGDLVRGWTPSGDTVLFASYRWKSGNNFQLHAISSEGGKPSPAPSALRVRRGRLPGWTPPRGPALRPREYDRMALLRWRAVPTAQGPRS